MPTEIVSVRARDARHFANEDGTRSVVFGRMQNYVDDSGLWQPVELNFAQVSATEWAADRNAYRVLAYRDTGAGVNWVEITHRNSGKGVRWQVPLSASVGTNYVEFAGFGLTWRYYLTKTGVKLQSSPVATPRGQRTYSFIAQTVGGATVPQIMEHGGLESDSFVVPRAMANCADGINRLAGVFSREGTTVTFDMDDTAFPPEAYPYVVDPTTTFNVAASGDDVTLRALTTGAWPPPSATATTNATPLRTEKNDAGSEYECSNTLLRWDTSSLTSDATVTGATLRVRVVASQSPTPRSFCADFHDWSGGTLASHYTATSGNDAISGVSLTSLTAGAYNDIALTGLTGVSTTGTTYLRTHITGAAPGTDEFHTITISSWDHATDIEPQLIVDYTLPSVPGPDADRIVIPRVMRMRA